jgi:hypothetical protein
MLVESFSRTHSTIIFGVVLVLWESVELIILLLETKGYLIVQEWL